MDQNQNFPAALAEAYRSELLTCLQDARRGLLSPDRQRYCFEEIAGTRNTPAYPADGDALLSELRRAVAGQPQITARECDAMQLAQQGGKLLFYCNHDRYTLAEIAALADGSYTAFVYLDGDASRGHLSEYAAGITAELDAWCVTQGVVPGPLPTDDEPERFPSLADAAAHLRACLSRPESILC